MRVCDIIAKFIYEIGIEDIFMVPGGGLMYLTDGLACNKNLNKVSCHHEQAVAMAAVGYAKYKGIGCGFVTTGCGGTNAMTGLLNAWQDNTPCIFISGQVKRKETIRNLGIPIRQLGVQEADIITLVDSITKYAVMINEPEDILYHLEKAYYLAKNGRPGPVWLDIPMDVSSTEVNESNLKHFNPEELKDIKLEILDSELQGIVDDLSKSKRPIIIAGQGIRLSGSLNSFDEFIHKHNIPIVCSRMGTDVIPTEDNLNIGRMGNKGTRAANFAVENADYVLALGSRLSVSSTGQEYEYFAREAKVVVVDIDKYEHTKNTIQIDEVINADLKDVLSKLKLEDNVSFDKWAQICLNWKEKYPVCLTEYYDDTNGINLYVFMEELNKYLKNDSVLVTDAGSAVFVPPQGIKTTTKEQRYITTGAQAEMGFTLPGCVGVSVARNYGEVLGITGDGSLQMNIQELQTVVYNELPIKLFVWNNNGYLSMRATQGKYFDGRIIGADSESGVSFPNLKKISEAYGIKYFRIEKISEFEDKMPKIMDYNGPVIIEVMCDPNQVIMPTVSSKDLGNGVLVSSPIEDMYPFLPRDEFLENMIIKPLDEK